MELQTQSKQIVADCLRSGERFQVAVGNDFNLEATSDSVKILSCDLTFKNADANASEKSVVVSGKINYKIIYLDENIIKNASYEADFSNAVQDEFIAASDGVIPFVNVMDSDYELNGKTLKTSCAIDICYVKIQRSSAEAVAYVDNAFCKSEDKETQVLRGLVKGVIDVTGDFSIGENIEETLSFISTPVLESAVCQDDKITVEGKVVCSVCLRFARGLETRYFDLPFSEEIKAEGAVKNGVCYADLSLSSDKMIITGEGSSVGVGFEIKLNVNAFVFGADYYTLCSDVFSVDSPVTLKKEAFDFCAFKYRKYFEERFTVGQTFEENMAIKNIINIFSPEIFSCAVTAEDGVLTVSGTLVSDVVYTDYDGAIKTVKAEAPFMVRRGVSESCQSDELFYSVALGALAPRVRRDNEIEISGDVYINVTAFDSRSFNYVSLIECGQEYDKKQPAVSVYFAKKGDTVWEIGKALKCAPENVKKLNPDLGDVLKGTEKVIIVRNK